MNRKSLAIILTLLVSLTIPVKAEKLFSTFRSLNPEDNLSVDVRASDLTDIKLKGSNTPVAKLRFNREELKAILGEGENKSSFFSIATFKVNADGTAEWKATSSHKRKTADKALPVPLPGFTSNEETYQFFILDEGSTVAGPIEITFKTDDFIVAQNANPFPNLVNEVDEGTFTEAEIKDLLKKLGRRIILDQSGQKGFKGGVRVNDNEGTLTLVLPRGRSKIINRKKTQFLIQERDGGGVAEFEGNRLFSGTLAQRVERDESEEGTVYIATDVNRLFVKQAGFGEWLEVIKPGEDGAPGAPGAPGQAGAPAPAVPVVNEPPSESFILAQRDIKDVAINFADIGNGNPARQVVINSANALNQQIRIALDENLQLTAIFLGGMNIPLAADQGKSLDNPFIAQDMNIAFENGVLRLQNHGPFGNGSETDKFIQVTALENVLI